jgi:hypothetical protein
VNTFPVHGLKGKTGNKNAKKMARVDSDFGDFFKELLDEAEVLATHLVRELTGIGLGTGGGREDRTANPYYDEEGAL